MFNVRALTYVLLQHKSIIENVWFLCFYILLRITSVELIKPFRHSIGKQRFIIAMERSFERCGRYARSSLNLMHFKELNGPVRVLFISFVSTLSVNTWAVCSYTVCWRVRILPCHFKHFASVQFTCTNLIVHSTFSRYLYNSVTSMINALVNIFETNWLDFLACENTSHVSSSCLFVHTYTTRVRRHLSMCVHERLWSSKRRNFLLHYDNLFHVAF